MAHLLVRQLRFARSEFNRGLHAVTAEEGLRRFQPMNSISWIVGHLASQENAYWVLLAQGRSIYPDLHLLVGYGRPATTPDIEEMWSAWREITSAADDYLDTLDGDSLGQHLSWKGQARAENLGTMLLRNTYHYWYHLGEAMAVRQMLGHTDLPEFIGDMSAAVYEA